MGTAGAGPHLSGSFRCVRQQDVLLKTAFLDKAFVTVGTCVVEFSGAALQMVEHGVLAVFAGAAMRADKCAGGIAGVAGC